MSDDHDDCAKAVRVVYEYLDGAMEVGYEEVETHIRRCRGCHDAVEFERVFLQRIRTACSGSAPPPSLVDKVRELLRRAEDR